MNREVNRSSDVGALECVCWNWLLLWGELRSCISGYIKDQMTNLKLTMYLNWKLVISMLAQQHVLSSRHPTPQLFHPVNLEYYLVRRLRLSPLIHNWHGQDWRGHRYTTNVSVCPSMWWCISCCARSTRSNIRWVIGSWYYLTGEQLSINTHQPTQQRKYSSHNQYPNPEEILPTLLVVVTILISCCAIPTSSST